jgi:hypothetical protein
VARIIQETEDAEILKLLYASNKQGEKWQDREGNQSLVEQLIYEMRFLIYLTALF